MQTGEVEQFERPQLTYYIICTCTVYVFFHLKEKSVDEQSREYFINDDRTTDFSNYFLLLLASTVEIYLEFSSVIFVNHSSKFSI